MPIRVFFYGLYMDASCHVLQSEETSSNTNPAYAAKLATLVSRLGLPPTYAREIEALVDGT